MNAVALVLLTRLLLVRPGALLPTASDGSPCHVKRVALCIVGEARTFATGGFQQLGPAATNVSLETLFHPKRITGADQVRKLVHKIGDNAVDVYVAIKTSTLPDASLLEQVTSLNPVALRWAFGPEKTPDGHKFACPHGQKNFMHHSAMPQYFRHHQCYDMIAAREQQCNSTYAWVMRSRPDVTYSDNFPNIDDWESVFSTDAVYSVHGHASGRCPNDMSAIFSGKLKHVVLNAWRSMAHCYPSSFFTGQGLPEIAECIYGDYFARRGLGHLTHTDALVHGLIRNCSAHTDSPWWQCAHHSLYNATFWFTPGPS